VAAIKSGKAGKRHKPSVVRHRRKAIRRDHRLSKGPILMVGTPLHSRPRRRTAAAIAIVTIAALGLTACAASPEPATDSTSAAAGLHMISNDGHRLAFYVTPGHQPAIILDAGGGNDSTYWKKLVPVLSSSTGSEIITYDRAGMGKSQYVPGPFDVKAAASDLAVGLKALDVSRGAVLVAHSEAGEIATNFVNDDPGVVGGAVLVDASLPQFYTPEETARIVAANGPQVAAVKKQKLTNATRQLIAAAENYGPAHQVYNALSWPSNVPAIAIVSASTPFPTTLDAQRWREAQAEFVKAASNRRLVTAAHSSHDIPLDRPGLVVQEVKDMVKDIR
jgi:pimeloyl-ACP methyl ester carboxylesterase